MRRVLLWHLVWIGVCVLIPVTHQRLLITPGEGAGHFIAAATPLLFHLCISTMCTLVCLCIFVSKESWRTEPTLASEVKTLTVSELPFPRLGINFRGCKWRPTGQRELGNMFYLVLAVLGTLSLTELVSRI